jgi:hypothetical protein
LRLFYFHRGATDRGEHRQVAEASAESLIALLFQAAALSGVTVVEEHELSKIDFELIEDAFKALLQSQPATTKGKPTSRRPRCVGFVTSCNITNFDESKN